MINETIEIAGAQSVAPFVTVDRKALADAIAFQCRHVIERRNTIPILSNVMLQPTDAGGLSIVGTDLDCQVELNLPAEWQAPGSITVGALALRDVLKKAPGATVRLIFEADRVRVEAGPMRVSVAALPVDDFPLMAAPDAPVTFSVPVSQFARDLAAVAPAMSSEEARYYMCGAAMQAADGVLNIAATNGRELASVARAMPEGAEDMADSVIPRRVVSALIAALKNVEASSLAVEMGQRRGVIAWEGARFTFKLVDGTFPDWRAVLDSATAETGLQRVAMIELDPRLPADRLAALAKGTGAPLSVETGEKTAVLTCAGYPEWQGVSVFRDESAANSKYGFNAHEFADRTAMAYLVDLATSRGLDVPPVDRRQLIQLGGLYVGATFGKSEWVRPEPVEVIDWETLSSRVECQAPYQEWEEGSYSVAMPRRNQSFVSVEFVGDDGEAAFQHLRTDAAGKLELSRETVRALCGECGERVEIAPLQFLHGEIVTGFSIPTFTVPGIKKPTDADKLRAYCADPAGVMARLAPVACQADDAAAETSPAERVKDVAPAPEPAAPVEAPSRPEIATQAEAAEPTAPAADPVEAMRALAERVAVLEAVIAARPDTAPVQPAIKTTPPVEPEERAALEAEIDRLREQVSVRDQVIWALRGNVAMLIAKRERTAARMRKVRKDARNGWAMAALETKRANEAQRRPRTPMNAAPQPIGNFPIAGHRPIVLPAVQSRPRLIAANG